MESVDFLVGILLGGAMASGVWYLRTYEWRDEVPKRFRKFVPHWAGNPYFDNEASQRALKGCLDTAHEVGAAWTRSKDEELDTFVAEELKRQHERKEKLDRLCRNTGMCL